MRADSRDEQRCELQSIDHDIHDLLMRRAGMSEAPSGDLVPSASTRAAQTARILRSVLARHSGSFPLRALVQIWCDIVFAGDSQTSLHVFAGEDAAGFRDLARTFFGCTLPITSHNSAMAVVYACADDPLAIGLVPPPESVENGQAWWEQLAPAGQRGPRISQNLPFVRNDSCSVSLPQGYAIATVEQQPTGRDTSVLRFECHAEMSRARLQSLLRQAGFEAQILAASRDASRPAASRLLVANKGFVPADDERLSVMASLADDVVERVALVGGFADPFDAATAS
jgi:chorismate mutase/prephenate dehydratase